MLVFLATNQKLCMGGKRRGELEGERKEEGLEGKSLVVIILHSERKESRFLKFVLQKIVNLY